MVMRSVTFLVLGCAIASSASACQDQSQSGPQTRRYAQELTATDEGRRFLLGRPGIEDALPTIDSGGQLDEKWTLITVPTNLLASDASTAQIDLSNARIQISHEFDADDPYTEDHDIKWFRFDFTTSPE